jgi:hypothetical protein
VLANNPYPSPVRLQPHRARHFLTNTFKFVPGLDAEDVLTVSVLGSAFSQVANILLHVIWRIGAASHILRGALDARAIDSERDEEHEEANDIYDDQHGGDIVL